MKKMKTENLRKIQALKKEMINKIAEDEKRTAEMEANYKSQIEKTKSDYEVKLTEQKQ
jgi:hypothetical protein